MYVNRREGICRTCGKTFEFYQTAAGPMAAGVGDCFVVRSTCGHITVVGGNIEALGMLPREGEPLYLPEHWHSGQSSSQEESQI